MQAKGASSELAAYSSTLRYLTSCAYSPRSLHTAPAHLEQNQPLLAGLELTASQRQTMDRVHASIAADFALRRRMLLRRCDVTVQSFLRDRDGGGGGKAVQGGGGAEARGAAGSGGGGDDEETFASLPPALRVRRFHTLAPMSAVSESFICVLYNTGI